MSDIDYRLNALLMQGRYADVTEMYRELPKSARRRADTINIYASALLMSGRHQEAFRLLNAIPYGQKSREIWNNLCLAGMQLECFEETLTLLDRGLRRFPEEQSLHLTRSRCFAALGRLEEAHEAALAALRIEENETALFAAGRTAQRIGKLDEAMEFYRGTLRLNPAHGAGAGNLDRLCWQLRRFSEVRALAEPRLHAPSNEDEYTRYLAAKCTPWTGEPLDGRPLHVIADQGVGDQIMFLQFLSRLADFVPGPVTVHVEPRLVPLFREGISAAFEVIFTPYQASIECRPTDMKVPLSSLPNYFVRSAEDFPRAPFLSLEAGGADFGHDDRRPVFGLAWWSARPEAGPRSLEVDDLAEALEGMNARFLSLQYRPADAGIDRLGERLGDRLIVPDGLDVTDDFVGVAKVCRQLDGVLTIPQTLVHVAGAVGARVGVLLPPNPSWRYDSPDDRMLWYGDHVRLIRHDASDSLKGRIDSFIGGGTG